jgi:hypothetical protein
MNRPKRTFLAQLALFIGLFVALVSASPSSARAAGTIRAEKTTLDEADGRWKLKLTIDHGSVPDIAFVPMLFSFEPTMIYDRELNEASPEKPVVVRKPLVGQQTINESMDVGFGDGSGKVFKGTKFDFVIRRDRGFFAGEYKLTVKKVDGGKTMGQPMRIVLNGDNEVVDRRPISFVGERAGKDGKAKSDKPKSDKPTSEQPKDESQASSEGEPSAPSEPAPSESAPSTDAAEPPPSVAPKQGGCGCAMVGDRTNDVPASVVAALAVGLVVSLRRRSRPRA